MPQTVLVVLYCALIVVSSLGGGWLPSAVRLTHARVQLLMSAVAGLMLGVALFHMLPHSFQQTGELERTMWWVTVGLLAMFFLIRAFHFHQHDVGLPGAGHCEHEHDHDLGHDHDHDHAHAAPHAQQGVAHRHDHPAAPMSHVRWIGVAFGLGLHTLIDGMALAAGVKADADQEVRWPLYGLGVFLAILLHKPLDAMSISSLMETQGISPGWRRAVNIGFAAMCPVGAALFVLGLSRYVDQQQLIIGCALGFAAGVFLCISLSDLLPELQFHEHDRLKLSAALLLGVALAYLIGWLEPTHIHALRGASM